MDVNGGRIVLGYLQTHRLVVCLRKSLGDSHIYIYICICNYIYIKVYIYIYRERERHT